MRYAYPPYGLKGGLHWRRQVAGKMIKAGVLTVLVGG